MAAERAFEAPRAQTPATPTVTVVVRKRRESARSSLVLAHPVSSGNLHLEAEHLPRVFRVSSGVARVDALTTGQADAAQFSPAAGAGTEVGLQRRRRSARSLSGPVRRIVLGSPGRLDVSMHEPGWVGLARALSEVGAVLAEIEAAARWQAMPLGADLGWHAIKDRLEALAQSMPNDPVTACSFASF